LILAHAHIYEYHYELVNNMMKWEIEEDGVKFLYEPIENIINDKDNFVKRIKESQKLHSKKAFPRIVI